MKYYVLAALLFASTSAIQLRDSEDEHQIMADETEVQTKLKSEKQHESQQKLQSQDKELIAAYQGKLDQTKRNVEQGEMGRSLAMGKILDMKQAFTGLASNIAEETQIIKDEIAQDQANKKINPGQQVMEIQGIEKSAKGILADISVVSELQNTIMATGTDGEVIPKDQDMQDATNKIESSVKDTKTFVSEYKATQEKIQKEALAQQESGDSDPLHTKARTTAEKEEMAAFLSGQ